MARGGVHWAGLLRQQVAGVMEMGGGGRSSRSWKCWWSLTRALCRVQEQAVVVGAKPGIPAAGAIEPGTHEAQRGCGCQAAMI